MPKDKDKGKNFICPGCEHGFTTRKGLTTHQNSCAELRKPVLTAEEEQTPKKKKKKRRLSRLKRLFSRNSQTSVQDPDINVFFYFKFSLLQ
jgi:hypothetical protein